MSSSLGFKMSMPTTKMVYKGLSANPCRGYSQVPKPTEVAWTKQHSCSIYQVWYGFQTKPVYTDTLPGWYGCSAPDTLSLSCVVESSMAAWHRLTSKPRTCCCVSLRATSSEQEFFYQRCRTDQETIPAILLTCHLSLQPTFQRPCTCRQSKRWPVGICMAKASIVMLVSF